MEGDPASGSSTVSPRQVAPPTEPVPLALLWLQAAGLAAIVAYSIGDSLEVLAIACLIALAATVSGALLGFLFGIPRSLATDAAAATGYGPNTNLEQISDWLTKILVGVGLVELGELRAAMSDVAADVGPALAGPGSESGEVVALATIVYFAVSGFLVGFLWTRLKLPGAFAQADRALLIAVAREAAAEETRETFAGQAAYDVTALSLVSRQLEDNGSPPTQQELDEAFAKASPTALLQAFNTARRHRMLNWREDVGAMERAAPIFEALVAADSERRFHRQFAELAYILKDKRAPDHRRALELLETAIAIRDQRGDRGFAIYELNRAFCRIALDDRARRGEPSTPETRDAVVDDLRVAAGQERTKAILLGRESVVEAWLEANRISIEEVAGA